MCTFHQDDPDDLIVIYFQEDADQGSLTAVPFTEPMICQQAQVLDELYCYVLQVYYSVFLM